jgi:hypothetical protein
MRLANLKRSATMVAVAMLLAAGASFASGGADASVLRPAAVGSAQSSGGTWGTAIEVPGTAGLNGGSAGTEAMSCPTAGNCSAGGSYLIPDFVRATQAFVVGETDGKWGTAIEVPGIGALNKGMGASVYSVSCSSPGNCSAGGDYLDASGHQQAFLVTETGGTWGTAFEVRGTATLNAGGYASIDSVSCAGAAGNCGAGGYYQTFTSSKYVIQPFVVTYRKGVWRTAVEVPGTLALNQKDAEITSMSCPTAGNCTAGGDYRRAGATQAFVVDETGGKWALAVEVPGTAALNTGGNAETTSLSCTTAGNCSAGGYYTDASGMQAFVTVETSGTWATAIEVPGTAALNASGSAEVTSVSCAPAGSCSAGGYYADATGHRQAFVVSQTVSSGPASRG